MKPPHARQRTGAFTGWDLLVVIVTLGILLFITLPAVTRTRSGKSPRIYCVSNLKQIGLAFRIWANDHGEKFPMALSSGNTNGGTFEHNLTGEVWRHFSIISNELNSPKVLGCASDGKRRRTSNWQDFTNNSHLSYFLGLDADETRPQTILSGDRNLESSVPSTNGVLFLRVGDRLEWTTSLHNKAGNIGLADGSAQQIYTTAAITKHLESALQSTGQPVHRLALPE